MSSTEWCGLTRRGSRPLIENLNAARVLPEINAGMADAGCTPGTVRRTVGAIKVERRDRRPRSNIRRAPPMLALLPLARGSQGGIEIARQRHALLVGPVVRPDVLLIVRQRGCRCWRCSL